MKDVYLNLDESRLRDREICYWLRLYQLDSDVDCFDSYPLIWGHRKTIYKKWNRVYTANRGAHLGIFTMKAKVNKAFWGIWKPYVASDQQI